MIWFKKAKPKKKTSAEQIRHLTNIADSYWWYLGDQQRRFVSILLFSLEEVNTEFYPEIIKELKRINDFAKKENAKIDKQAKNDLNKDIAKYFRGRKR